MALPQRWGTALSPSALAPEWGSRSRSAHELVSRTYPLNRHNSSTLSDPNHKHGPPTPASSTPVPTMTGRPSTPATTLVGYPQAGTHPSRTCPTLVLWHPPRQHPSGSALSVPSVVTHSLDRREPARPVQSASRPRRQRRGELGSVSAARDTSADMTTHGSGSPHELAGCNHSVQSVALPTT